MVAPSYLEVGASGKPGAVQSDKKVDQRYTINGRSETVLVNKAAHAQIELMKANNEDDGDIIAWLKTVIKPIKDIVPM